MPPRQPRSAEHYEEEHAARRALEKMTREAGEVIVDRQTHGALYLFIKDQYERAIGAMLALATVPATDAQRILELQAEITPYMAACRYVRMAVESGKEADQIIKENFGDDDHDDGPFRD